MKKLGLIIGLLFVAVVVLGCAKKPVEYSPKSPAETNILQFVKGKVANAVVVNVAAPPPGVPGAPYSVTLANPKDGTKTVMVPVVYDDKEQKVVERRPFEAPPIPQ